ncbi:unnamed protein product [Rotaria sp. Silwood1]|nr:unnamed protein product [Rotaria sp. Silwood1]CAF1363957.1 unnamed protein product [Rotaria sp. Silwood1]CAF1364892.1 unnamed protein product [Rotaria sp. Silwood1]CAF3544158.1 unnamed protein product [Rotaria sp. Silwood1]CAF3550986.1 unnamed protein product [Rotaria sp. Silwood1]
MVQYQATCSAPLCTNVYSWPGSSGYSCPTISTCYRLRTSTNGTICVPQGVCRLFDTCINGTRCTSNLTTCVVDSCCSVPICIPLALTSLCDQSTPTGPSAATQIRLCPNATWNENYTTLFNSSNSMYNNMIVDYFVDANGSIYIANGSANHVIKYTSRNLSVAFFMGSGSFSPYTFQRMTVDTNGTVYTSEYRSGPMFYSPATYYRIQRYDSNSSLFGTTIFGETACGTPPNQFCGCADIFIDRRNAIYCSDSFYHIVIMITPINPQATVVAGTTNSPGSQLNQLNSPQGIFVDTNGTVFVVDSGNK